MPAQLGNAISRADYNAIQSQIDSVLGSGDGGQNGYGRTLQSSQITTNKVIESEDMLALYNDLIKARTHQAGTSLNWTNTTGLNAPSDDELIGVFAADIGTNPNDPTDVSSAYSTRDENEGFRDFEAAGTDIVNGHDLQGPGQMTISQASSSSRTAQWGGGDVSAPGSFINHTVTITWANADERRYFFNSGGEIQFSANLDISVFTGTKNANWKSMLSTQGTITFDKNSTSANGTNPGIGSSIGNYYSQWANTSSSNPVILYQKLGTDLYADNSYTIQAWQTASNSIRFNIIFQDGDLGTGSPGVAGDTPIDEYVTGTTNSLVQIKTATGTLDIDVPGVSTSSTLAGGVGGTASINLSANQTEIDEGESVVFSISTSNITAGTIIPYALTGINTTDITASQLTGNFVVGTTESVTVTTTLDEITDGDKTMTMTLPSNGGVSRSVIIRDTSKSVGFSLSGPANIAEGSNGFYTFDAPNLLADETFFWTIDTSAPTQFVNTTGQFVYQVGVPNQGITVQTPSDTIIGDTVTGTLNIYRYAQLGNPGSVPLLGVTFNVIDTSEDVFTLKFDSTKPGGVDPANGVENGASDTNDSEVVFLIKGRTQTGANSGNLNGDIQFRVRKEAGDTGTPNITLDSWLYFANNNDTDILAAIEMSTPGTFHLDIKGTAQMVFGARYPGTINSDSTIRVSLWGSGGKVVDVENWGTQFNPTSFRDMFLGCAHLTGFTASGHPRIMGTPGDMDNMFENCIELTGTGTNGNTPFSQWDMSTAVSLTGMFKDCYKFEGALNTWNVSNVTNMKEMFQFCARFNTDLSSWDVSNVINMSFMFGMYNNNLLVPPATQGLFNADIGNWDVSSCVQMDGMFANNAGFNQDLTNWCVTNIPNLPQSFAFGNSILDPTNYPIWGTCPPTDPTSPPLTNATLYTPSLESSFTGGTANAGNVDDTATEEGTAIGFAVCQLFWYAGNGDFLSGLNPYIACGKINGSNLTSKYYPVGTYPSNGTAWTNNNWITVASGAPVSFDNASEFKVVATNVAALGFGETGLSNPGTITVGRATSTALIGTTLPPQTGTDSYNFGDWIPVTDFDVLYIPGARARSIAGAGATEAAAVVFEFEFWVRGTNRAGGQPIAETLVAKHRFAASAYSDGRDYLAP